MVAATVASPARMPISQLRMLFRTSSTLCAIASTDVPA